MSPIDTYLAGTRADQREKTVVQEVRLRAAIVVGRSIIDKLTLDYRFAVRMSAFRRLDEAFAEMLAVFDEPRSKVHRDYTEDLVHSNIKELYVEIMQILRGSEREITELVDESLYPKDESERQWWQQLGVIFGHR